ncbi:MAG: tetratricopeptide repeat protein, partial [Muribaculaceae bacterium]|nr:tetratricopeptide repeat protein [Muribaculaceae bacterium]
LAESPDWHSTVKLVWQQFIRSRLTDRIDGKFRDEVLPAMMKLKDKLPSDINMIDPEALAEINPEWEEMFEKEGLSKKLAELSELQNEGADLNHSTFGQLKQFPFFSDMANWFMPFDSDHTAVAEAASRTSSLSDVLSGAPFLCDSDKYSLVLSLNHVPGNQKEALDRQMNVHSGMLSRMAAEDMLPDDERRRNIINRYIQDLYRFFRHFRRKEEFADPFRSMIDLSEFAGPDADTPRVVAELCFAHGYYSEALTLFNRISEPDATVMQKRGYALQQLGRLREALASFEKAELMQSDSAYTLRRIGALHRRLGHPAAAIEYFRRLQTLRPDDMGAVLSEGHCRLDMGMYREALHCYYRAEFMDETSLKPVRPIAWAALLLKDFDTSRRYYARLMAEATPDAADYLNMGHLNLAGGDPRDSLNFYRLFASGKSA